VGVYYWLSPRVVPFQKTEITRLTTNGRWTIAAISPDGRYVAYVTDEGVVHGRETLWVRRSGLVATYRLFRPPTWFMRAIFSR